MASSLEKHEMKLKKRLSTTVDAKSDCRDRLSAAVRRDRLSRQELKSWWEDGVANARKIIQAAKTSSGRAPPPSDDGSVVPPTLSSSDSAFEPSSSSSSLLRPSSICFSRDSSAGASLVGTAVPLPPLPPFPDSPLPVVDAVLRRALLISEWEASLRRDFDAANDDVQTAKNNVEAFRRPLTTSVKEDRDDVNSKSKEAREREECDNKATKRLSACSAKRSGRQTARAMRQLKAALLLDLGCPGAIPCPPRRVLSGERTAPPRGSPALSGIDPSSSLSLSLASSSSSLSLSPPSGVLAPFPVMSPHEPHAKLIIKKAVALLSASLQPLALAPVPDVSESSSLDLSALDEESRDDATAAAAAAAASDDGDSDDLDYDEDYDSGLDDPPDDDCGVGGETEAEAVKVLEQRRALRAKVAGEIVDVINVREHYLLLLEECRLWSNVCERPTKRSVSSSNSSSGSGAPQPSASPPSFAPVPPAAASASSTVASPLESSAAGWYVGSADTVPASAPPSQSSSSFHRHGAAAPFFGGPRAGDMSPASLPHRSLPGLSAATSGAGDVSPRILPPPEHEVVVVFRDDFGDFDDPIEGDDVPRPLPEGTSLFKRRLGVHHRLQYSAVLATQLVQELWTLEMKIENISASLTDAVERREQALEQLRVDESFLSADSQSSTSVASSSTSSSSTLGGSSGNQSQVSASSSARNVIQTSVSVGGGPPPTHSRYNRSQSYSSSPVVAGMFSTALFPSAETPPVSLASSPYTTPLHTLVDPSQLSVGQASTTPSHTLLSFQGGGVGFVNSLSAPPVGIGGNSGVAGGMASALQDGFGGGGERRTSIFNSNGGSFAVNPSASMGRTSSGMFDIPI